MRFIISGCGSFAAAFPSGDLGLRVLAFRVLGFRAPNSKDSLVKAFPSLESPSKPPFHPKDSSPELRAHQAQASMEANETIYITRLKPAAH